MSTPRRSAHRSLRTRFLVALLLIVGSGGAAVGPGAAVASAQPDTPPPFGGTVDEFFAVHDPLLPGEPGELIRVQTLGTGGGSTSLRIMYHSRDSRGRDRAVTGTLTFPDGPAPPGGWPVVSTANGTVGMASRCALSRSRTSATTWGLAAVGVATDYIGLGPVGELHPYLSRLSEGHSVIDAVRAARNVTETGAGARWLAIGGSQGGHGAISAHELSATYAPELELVGTVACAPAAMLDRTYGPLDEVVAQVVGGMMLYGAATEHPEIDPNDYVGPEVAAASSVIQTGCLGDIIPVFASIPTSVFYVRSPVSTEPARSILLANDVGHVASDAPMLLVQGTADQTVPPARTRDLFARLCTTRQVTDYRELEGADHNNIGVQSAPEVAAWIADRFGGVAGADSCGDTLAPPAVAPVPVPAPVVLPRFAG